MTVGPDNPVSIQVGDPEDFVGITSANVKALGGFPIATTDGTILLNPKQLYFPEGLAPTVAATINTPAFSTRTTTRSSRSRARSFGSWGWTRATTTAATSS